MTNQSNVLKKYMYSNQKQHKDNRRTQDKMYSVVRNPDNSVVLGVDIEKAPPPAPPEPEPEPEPVEEFVSQPLWFLVCLRLMFLLQFALIFQTLIEKPIYPVIVVRVGHIMLTSAVWIINEIVEIQLNKKMKVIYTLCACQCVLIILNLAMLLDLYLLLVIFLYSIVFALLFGTR